MNRLALATVTLIALAFPQGVYAAAKKAVRLTCDAYSAYERRCHCGGSAGYFLSYGRKYCDRSLAVSGWSPAGARWRDRTLSCLQQVLTRAIPRNHAQACNCEAIKNFAFDSHVACYTQLPASFCRLPLSDQLITTSIIDADDLLSAAGARQIWAIAQTCLRQ
jgi:hypothetical protein